MKYITKALNLAVPVLLLVGCSKPASPVTKADLQMAEDMSQFTNTVFQVSPYFKKIESGALGREVSVPISVGKTNEEQRHYILTWKEHRFLIWKEPKWQITRTNR